MRIQYPHHVGVRRSPAQPRFCAACMDGWAHCINTGPARLCLPTAEFTATTADSCCHSSLTSILLCLILCCFYLFMVSMRITLRSMQNGSHFVDSASGQNYRFSQKYSKAPRVFGFSHGTSTMIYAMVLIISVIVIQALSLSSFSHNRI